MVFWMAVADDMQTICTLLQTDNHSNTSSLHFLAPQSIEGNASVFSNVLTVQ